MFHGIPLPAVDNPRPLLRRLLDTIDERVFGAVDASAREKGLRVTRSFGRHTYRDPRFDALRECMACEGEGTEPGGARCARCRGTGRVNLLLSERGRRWEAG